MDARDGKRVAPKNVVMMLMHFGPLNDGIPRSTGSRRTSSASGAAWIATNGKTIKGTWRKESLTAPTKFYNPAGKQVTLTAGQTFINVMPLGTKVTITKGAPPPASTPAPIASPCPAARRQRAASPSEGPPFRPTGR